MRPGEGGEQNKWERTPGEEAGEVGPCHAKKMRMDPTRQVGAWEVCEQASDTVKSVF